MRVAIIGGTGDLGEGLAVRFGRHTDHEVLIGSRDAEKARSHAERYQNQIGTNDADSSIVGETNLDAARVADVVILSVPPYHARDTVAAIEDALVSTESILISPVVGLSTTDTGTEYDRPPIGSVTELIDNAAPPDTPVVGAFHNVPAERLADPSADLSMDVLVVGDDGDDKAVVADLIADVEGFRPVNAGPLAHAAKVESLTSLLIDLSEYNDDMQDVGLKFV